MISKLPQLLNKWDKYLERRVQARYIPRGLRPLEMYLAWSLRSRHLSYTYQPFKKPNDDTIYIHNHSNYPPSVITQLPISISQSIFKLSSEHSTFQHAAPTYNNVLKHRGFRSNIEFPPDETHTHLQQVIRKTEQDILFGSTRGSVKTLKPTTARNFLTYSTITSHLLIP